GTRVHPGRLAGPRRRVQLERPGVARDDLGLGVVAGVADPRERGPLSLHGALPIYPLFAINVTVRDLKSKNVYSRVNSKATTQWRKTESANGVHLEGVASDNRSS